MKNTKESFLLVYITIRNVCWNNSDFMLEINDNYTDARFHDVTLKLKEFHPNNALWVTLHSNPDECFFGFFRIVPYLERLREWKYNTFADLRRIYEMVCSQNISDRNKHISYDIAEYFDRVNRNY